jgi:hypothetical protein
MNPYVERNERWAQELRQVSVIMQVNYLDSEAESSLSYLGEKIRQKSQAVYERYAATMLIGVNKVASEGYFGGELWSKLLPALDNLPDTAPNRAIVSNLYRRGLVQYGLTRFDHPLSNIGEMILHSGVPLSSLDKLMARLLRTYEEVQGLTGEMFNSDIRDLSVAQVAAKSLDKPTWRFIKQSGAIADDFIDRFIDIIDDMQDGEYDEGGGSGLPNRVIQRVVEIIKLRQASGTINRKIGQKRIGKPKFRWHEIYTQNELRIELPQLANALNRTISWIMFDQTANFELITFPSLSRSREDTGFYSVTSPAPIFTISGQPANHEGVGNANQYNWDAQLYKSDEWLLVFDEDGYFQSGSGTLSPGRYKILYPEAMYGKTNSLVFGGVVESGEAAVPEGWSGQLDGGSWVAVDVWIREAQSIELKNADTTLQTRYVSNLVRPTFDVSEVVVSSVYDLDGKPVISNLPKIVLPPSSDLEAGWSVQIRDAAGKIVHAEEIFVDSYQGKISELEPFAELDGSYQISISSRRLGLNTRSTFTIVQGLTTAASPATRRISISNQGLDTCQVTLMKAGKQFEYQLEFSQPKIEVNDPKVSKDLLIIRPDYESIELFNRVSGNRSEWFSPAKSHLEDLGNLELSFTFLGDRHPNIIAKWPGDKSRPLDIRVTGGKLKVSLAGLTDDAKLNGAFDILAIWPDDTTLELLNAYNKKLYEAFDLDCANRVLTVKFPNGNPPRNLRLTLYPEFAPWKQPVVIDDFKGAIELDSEIIQTGTMIAELDIIDLFVRSSPSKQITWGANTFRLEVPEEYWSNRVDGRLALWCKTGLHPANLPNVSVELSWLIYLSKPRFAKPEELGLSASYLGSLQQVKNYCLGVLSSNPQIALSKYPLSEDSSSESFSNLISIGAIDTKGVEELPYQQAVMSKPLLAILLNNFSNQFSSEEEASGELAKYWGLELPLKVDQLDNQEVPTIVEICVKKAGSLAFAVNPSNPIFFFADPDRIEDYIQMNNLPQGKYFDSGTLARLVAGLVQDSQRIATLDHIDLYIKLAEPLAAVDSEFHEAFQSLALTRPVLKSEALEQIKGTQKRIMNISALTLRLSLLARLVARGNPRAIGLWERKPFQNQNITVKEIFFELCRELPGICEHDLVLAELTFQIKGAN